MKRVSPTLIGAFVLGAVALAVAAVLILGSGRFFSNMFPFILYFPGQVDGLRVGAPVRFKGVDIGAVSKIMLHYEQPPEDSHIPVFIDLDLERVKSAGGWSDFAPERMRTAIERGLRAQLQSESLLTGLLFVQLDFSPDSPLTFVGLSDKVAEIPTLPTALEQVQTVIRRLLDKLEKLDFDKLFSSIENSVDAIDRLVNSPEVEQSLIALQAALESMRQLSDSLNREAGPAIASIRATAERTRATLAELDATLAATRKVIAPESPLAYQVGKTLEDISHMARSMRALMDSLERDPSILLRGRSKRRQE